MESLVSEGSRQYCAKSSKIVSEGICCSLPIPGSFATLSVSLSRIDAVVRIIEGSESDTTALSLGKDFLEIGGYAGIAIMPAYKHPKKAEMNSRPGGY